MQQHHRRTEQRHRCKGAAPTQCIPDQRAQRNAQHRRCGHAAEDDRGSQADAVSRHQARSQTAGDGPDAAHAEPHQHPCGQQPADARCQRRREVGDQQERKQRAQDATAINATGCDHHQRCEHCRQQGRQRDHQAGGAGGRAEIFGDRGQQADRQHFGGDHRERGEADGGNRPPRMTRHSRGVRRR